MNFISKLAEQLTEWYDKEIQRLSTTLSCLPSRLLHV